MIRSKHPIYLHPTTWRVVTLEGQAFLRIAGRNTIGEGTYVDLPLTTTRLASLVQDAGAAIITIEEAKHEKTPSSNPASHPLD